MAVVQQALLRTWTRRGPLAWALWPISLVFSVLTAIRRKLYQYGVLHAHRLPVPVVVVGNVTVGGAGKTPVTMALAKYLTHHAIRTGIVARGYGRQGSHCMEVTAQSLAGECGDEALLMARTTGLPVFVANSRHAAAMALLAKFPATQVILSDDGLQHLRLARDIEICVFDDRGTGNGFALPAGPLREPWPRAVDWVLHTGNVPVFEGFRAERRLGAHAVRADGTQSSLAALASAGVVAVAGIAQPDKFFAMLREQGLNLVDTVALPDHYSFDSGWRNQYAGQTLICTEKDAVKLWAHRPDAWAVPLEISLAPAFLQAFRGQLAAKLSSSHGSETA